MSIQFFLLGVQIPKNYEWTKKGPFQNLKEAISQERGKCSFVQGYLAKLFWQTHREVIWKSFPAFDKRGHKGAGKGEEYTVEVKMEVSNSSDTENRTPIGGIFFA